MRSCLAKQHLGKVRDEYDAMVCAAARRLCRCLTILKPTRFLCWRNQRGDVRMSSTVVVCLHLPGARDRGLLPIKKRGPQLGTATIENPPALSRRRATCVKSSFGRRILPLIGFGPVTASAAPRGSPGVVSLACESSCCVSTSALLQLRWPTNPTASAGGNVSPAAGHSVPYVVCGLELTGV
jgi:hypothetical protein